MALSTWPLVYAVSPPTINVTDPFTARGLTPRVDARLTEFGLVESLVGGGVGYGFLMSPSNARSTRPEERPAVVRLLGPPATVSHVVGIWPEDMNLTPRASARWLRDGKARWRGAGPELSQRRRLSHHGVKPSHWDEGQRGCHLGWDMAPPLVHHTRQPLMT